MEVLKLSLYFEIPKNFSYFEMFANAECGNQLYLFCYDGLFSVMIKKITADSSTMSSTGRRTRFSESLIAGELSESNFDINHLHHFQYDC